MIDQWSGASTAVYIKWTSGEQWELGEVVSIKSLVNPLCAAGGRGDNSGVGASLSLPPSLCIRRHSQPGRPRRHTQMLCHHSLLSISPLCWSSKLQVLTRHSHQNKGLKWSPALGLRERVLWWQRDFWNWKVEIQREMSINAFSKCLERWGPEFLSSWIGDCTFILFHAPPQSWVSVRKTQDAHAKLL